MLGIGERGLRKRLDGSTSPWFPLDGKDSPIVVVSKKLRLIDVDMLPATFTSRLLPEQSEMIEQLLEVPMGSTQWGGRNAQLIVATQ